ncbi:MAG: PQQ-binding-like beta-propeller repeat protein [Bryobacterales bacterium]|nr:PQQ-binding-like beta-propeller repeat protein [Acidobacteriota bacterium]MCB9384694.1 PQQ-binding-like beta-propeller repeat protein [Bryobacterales bacterium]
MRIIRMLAVIAILAAAGWLAMRYVFGMRLELSGSGSPIVSFENPEQHMAELEREREEQPPLPAAPETVEPSAQPNEAAAQPVEPEPAHVAAPWPSYRGSERDGVIADVEIRTDWPLEEAWRTKVGGGYASMIVAEGKLYTIEQRREQEVLAAYDLPTGREVWTHGWDAHFQEVMGGPGPRATPTYAEGRVFALGAKGNLRCLRASNGELLWKTNILADAGADNLEWGMAGAPLVVDGRVIVEPGGPEGKLAAAYDAETGRIVWQSLDGKGSYASPQMLTLGGQAQVLLLSADKLISADLKDGRALWSIEWPSPFDVNASQPIPLSDGELWVSSGDGQARVAVSREGGAWTARKVWENNGMKNKFNPSVLYRGHVYGLDNGILAAYDVETGERDWKGGRYGFGQLLLADGHLIVLTETGELVLVKATPESHQELARYQALEGKTWNLPAYADGLLLVRNQTEMAAYRLAR